MVCFRGAHFEAGIILVCARWYLAYPLSYRQIEEIMKECGIEVDHSTLQRKGSVGKSWRMDQTYIKVKGKCKYLYRAVDKTGQTVDFLLTADRDRKAAKRFLRKALGSHGRAVKIIIDNRGANTAAIDSYNAEQATDIELRQVKYLNNIVEQDHRAIKRLVRPMLAFKLFGSLI